MSQPRRIVWIVSGDEGYGVRRAVLSLVESVRAAGWSASIAVLADGPFAAECREMGWPVIPLEVGKAPVLAGGMLRKATGMLRVAADQHRRKRALVDAVRALEPDALHVLWPSLVSIAGGAARELGVPCFWEMPNILGRYPLGANRRIYQAICYRCGVVPLANSRYTAASLGHFPVKTRVMYLGADATRFDPDKVSAISRERLGIGREAIVLGIFARMQSAKGQDRVLQAMLRVGSDGPPLHLLLLGGPLESPFAQSLRDAAAAAGASQRLHMPGIVDKPEEYYGAIDVAVNFTTEAEPFGLSVIEAMMMGKPVLVHAAGGPAETVIDGVTGWHVHDASVTSLTGRLRRALADRDKWTEMGSAARGHALEHFTLAKQTRFYMDVVEQVLGKQQ